MLVTVMFIVLASLPFLLDQYLKHLCTVNSTLRVAHILKISSDVLLVSQLLQLLFTILYLSGSGVGAVFMGIGIHLVWGTGAVIFSRITWTLTVRCNIAVLAFHDFLINYKSTPRSKILRRHLP